MKSEKTPLVVEIFLAIGILSFNSSDSESGLMNFEYVTMHSHKLL
jgi:hypothetical protein